jgi:hypothetical protein
MEYYKNLIENYFTIIYFHSRMFGLGQKKNFIKNCSLIQFGFSLFYFNIDKT